MMNPWRPALAFKCPLRSPVNIGLHARGYRPTGGLFQAAATAISVEHHAVVPQQTVSPQSSNPPLSLLPFKSLVRSYLINALSANQLLLNLSLRTLSLLAFSKSPFLSPDRNPVLRLLLKKTFYAQFCAGETRTEIQQTVNGLKSIGFSGAILAYAKEVVAHKGQDLSKCKSLDDGIASADVESWKQGNLKTIDLTDSGEFIGLKFTGAGAHAIQLLATEQPPSLIMDQAITEICDFARAKNVRLLFDAEQNAIQRGIEAWTLLFQRKYNKGKSGTAIVYGTYQAYLRSTPTIVSQHLEAARVDGFRLGVKLVRGAYMATDYRHLFWADKEGTDRAYDGITEALVTREYNDVLQPHSKSVGSVPEVELVLATHNHKSVKEAMNLMKQQAMTGERCIDMVYGQLMGMADEVGCGLIQASKTSSIPREDGGPVASGPKTFKYLVWGSVGECMQYLLRRAEENRDAVLRAAESREALGAELRRRLAMAITFEKSTR